METKTQTRDGGRKLKHQKTEVSSVIESINDVALDVIIRKVTVQLKEQIIISRQIVEKQLNDLVTNLFTKILCPKILLLLLHR